MTVTRSEIVATAKSLLGTRWLHQGRSRLGVDCVGLIYVVGDELGLVPKGLYIPPYRTQPDPSLLSYFERHLDPVPPRKVGDGSVVIFGFGSSAHHAGIVCDVNASSLVHAHAAKKAVVYDHLESRARGRVILRAFDFRGVIDG